MAELWQNCVQMRLRIILSTFPIGMVKVLKKKIKSTLDILSKCHFGLEVLVYNNNDCQNVLKKSVIRQNILSYLALWQKPRARSNSFFSFFQKFYHTYRELKMTKRAFPDRVRHA